VFQQCVQGFDFTMDITNDIQFGVLDGLDKHCASEEKG
jgi:hypothetical protein